MGFKCGIIGLPNVGKSTLFNALTKASVEASNFPFCTIDPHSGIVSIPDTRLDRICEIVQPKKVIPAIVEFVDIAGLIAGSSKGEGLGNQFLANIRETHAVGHVVRCFDEDNIVHVNNKVDPRADIEIINTELVLADLESCEKQLQRVTRKAKGGHEDAIAYQACLEKTIQYLEKGVKARNIDFTEDEKKLVTSFHLLTMKPTMYIANIAEDGFQNNPYLDSVQAIADEEGSMVVPICNKLEAEIAELDEQEKKEFLLDIGGKSGLDRVIHTGYHLLGLQTYFTAGPKEVRAWTIPIGAKAPEAAGVIHSDFQRGFIRAEVIHYDDFIEFKGEQGAKEKGKLRSEGKGYVVQDGDIMHFLYNV